jgi:hypothetical protein
MPNRIHNLADLRETIKTNATRARELRQEARETEGEDRHYLKCEANEYGELTREPHLAVGYLRGRTIEQMESETTRPDNLPSAHAILSYAKRVFLRGPDADSWPDEERTESHKTVLVPDNRGIFAKIVGTPAPEPKTQVVAVIRKLDPPGWDEFKAHVEADLKAWKARIIINHTMKVARRAAARKELPVGGSAEMAVA